MENHTQKPKIKKSYLKNGKITDFKVTNFVMIQKYIIEIASFNKF